MPIGRLRSRLPFASNSATRAPGPSPACRTRSQGCRRVRSRCSHAAQFARSSAPASAGTHPDVVRAGAMGRPRPGRASLERWRSGTSGIPLPAIAPRVECVRLHPVVLATSLWRDSAPRRAARRPRRRPEPSPSSAALPARRRRDSAHDFSGVNSTGRHIRAQLDHELRALLNYATQHDGSAAESSTEDIPELAELFWILGICTCHDEVRAPTGSADAIRRSACPRSRSRRSSASRRRSLSRSASRPATRDSRLAGVAPTCAATRSTSDACS